MYTGSSQFSKTASKKQKIVGIIPARYASSRFPAKMLATIAGKSLIQRTYENARRCTALDETVIATDDQRIFDHIQDFGGEAVMTDISCQTGTDRLVDALKRHRRFDDASIIINVQGDEPCMELSTIQRVADILVGDPTAVMSTAAVPLISDEEAQNSSIVKCVFDLQHNALYFTRALIPAGHTLKMRSGMPYYRHMGIYGYRRDFLLRYAELPPSPLQLAEDLEQLKVLENGFRIKVAIVNNFSIGVDRPEDVQKVEQWLCKQNTSSSLAASARR